MTSYRQSMKDTLEIMYAVREASLLERDLTPDEEKRREEIAKDLPDDDFKKRYGDKWKSVKMATATKMMMKTTVDNDDNITVQGSVAPEEGLFNSAAILSEISLLTREEVESKMREYGADGLEDCDRNFDHLINILSTPRTSMVDSSKRLSLTRADWTILRNSTLFCSMFFSTLMRQVSHFPRFLSFSNVFGFTHLNMYSIGNPQLGLSTRCRRELPTTRCSVWHYTSRQQLQ